MYRCSICEAVSKAREPLRKHPVTRTVSVKRIVNGRLTDVGRTEIAKELSCCETCFALLSSGVALEAVIRTRRPRSACEPPPPPRPLRPTPKFQPVALKGNYNIRVS